VDVVVLIARILFAFIFVMSGIGHLSQTDAMAGYAAAKKVPMARASVQLSGLLMILGALSVLLGVWGDLGALVLAALMIVTPLMMHSFWSITDAGEKQGEQVHFNKDIALAGGALAFFALYHWDLVEWVVTGPLFD
jgi:putative oxidoreductase